MRRVAPSMKLGFSLPVAGAWATPANQLRVAREAERLGYHSLWVLQRLLVPVAPQNDYPPMPGRAWPDFFESVADPVVSLAFVAGRDVANPPRHERPRDAVLHAGDAREAARNPGPGVGRPPRRRARRGLVPGRVRRGRRALRAAWTARRRVPRLPQGHLDGGPRRVLRRVLPGATVVRPAPTRPDAPSPDHHRRVHERGRAAGGRVRERLQRRQRAARPCRATRPGAARRRRASRP